MNQIIMSSGKLVFDPEHRTNKHHRQGDWKKTAMIVLNDDTCAYYQWFIENRYKLISGRNANTKWINPPLRGTHVTIINDRINDVSLWNRIKEKYDGKEMTFFYAWEGLRNNGEHLYFKVVCPMADEVRAFGNLGDPYYGYHLTIGYVPEDTFKKEHNEYIRSLMIRSQFEANE